MKTVFALFVLLVSGNLYGAKKLTPVLQGVTTPTQVGFAINYKSKEPYFYKVRNVTTGLTVDPIEVIRTYSKYSRDQVDKAYFSNLSYLLDYVLLIIHPDGREEEREFRLMNPFQRFFRLAMVSCTSYLNGPQFGIWNHLIGRDPDLVIFGGDNVYAGLLSTAIPRRIWKIYHLTRNRLPIFRSKKLFPTIAIWDDHDFGKNNAGKDFKFRKETTDIFNAFYAQDIESNYFEKGPGISSHLRAFGMEFLLLDDRTFLEPKGKDHWGGDQRNWMSTKISQTSSPVMVINGVQFFGGYMGPESVESDHPDRLNWLLDEIEASQAKVFFGSGDRHYTEIMTVESLPYTTYEFTSSGMHSFSHGGAKFNPRRLDIYNADNFLTLDLLVEKHGVDIDYRIIDKNGDATASGNVRVPAENLSSESL